MPKSGKIGTVPAFLNHIPDLVGNLALGIRGNGGPIDYLNRRRAQGIGNHESIIEAAEARIRPIVLTTVTTAVGLLPTTYGIGGLDPFVVYITMALSWGLMFGSILIIFLHLTRLFKDLGDDLG